MGNYISSNNTRLYAAVEGKFGQVQAIDATNRLPAVEFNAHQRLQQTTRRDKTGTRSFIGASDLSRRATAFSLTTYLSTWNPAYSPSCGPLLQSACGGAPTVSSLITVSRIDDPLHFVTSAPHGLEAGSGVSQGTEVRFVADVVDPFSVKLNAPFSSGMTLGVLLSPCVTYSLGNNLPSCTLFDYWDPVNAIQRVVTGATVQSLAISLNGGFHEMTFAGLAADIIDSESFVAGAGGVQTFPREPSPGAFDYSIVGGHLGQAWLGLMPQQVFTLTQASIQMNNNIVPRNMEFGHIYPTSFAAGPREVSMAFSIFVEDDAVAKSFYVAAKQRTPISAMFQLGQQRGQLMGVYLPAVELEMPMFDDRQSRLIWEFKANLARGTNNDEIVVALA